MDSVVDLLRSGSWVVLRTEIEAWDDGDEDSIGGFDGFTRFWCPEAVFDIYWIAEHAGNRLTMALTEDLILTGFRRPLAAPHTDRLRELAELLDWRRQARVAVMSLRRQQFDLFEDE